MALSSDIIVIGGGIAGLSGGAAMAADARVIVLEAEEQTGFHTSGRSATMFHYALGNHLVRRLTQASRALFDNPPDEFGDTPLGRQMTLLLHSKEDEIDRLHAERDAMAPFATFEMLDATGLARLCPLLKVGDGGSSEGLADHDCLKIDQHALMQGFARQLRALGGSIATGARVGSIVREGGVWKVTTEKGEHFQAATLVNAAGAWGDVVAQLAGARSIGLAPLRRTIITFDAPPDTDLQRLPFTKTVHDELYFGAESGRLFASPMDEEPSEPCDSRPDEVGVASVAWRVEERTHARVAAIHSKWSGLRTFTADRKPAVGYDPVAEGFFWLAGQGGAGLQTSPALSQVAADLIARRPISISGIDPAALDPGRFLGQPA